MGVLDGAGAEASGDTQASHLSNSCAEKAHADAGLAESSTCFSPGRLWPRSGLGRPLKVSSAYMLTAHFSFSISAAARVTVSCRQSCSIRQSQPDSPDMSGLCTQQKKANFKTQYLPRFPGQCTATWS